MTSRVKPSDITRAIKTVMKAGLTVTGVEIEGDRLRVLTGAPQAAEGSSADEFLEKLSGKKNGGGRRAP